MAVFLLSFEFSIIDLVLVPRLAECVLKALFQSLAILDQFVVGCLALLVDLVCSLEHRLFLIASLFDQLELLFELLFLLKDQFQFVLVLLQGLLDLFLMDFKSVYV